MAPVQRISYPAQRSGAFGSNRPKKWSQFSANASAPPINAAPNWPGIKQIGRASEAGTSRQLGSQRRLGSFRYQPLLFLGQRGVQVQHERIGIPAQFSNHGRRALGHQAGHKGHLTR
jgi:hypothetical protein